MDANELMIGDWVQHQNHDVVGKVILINVQPDLVHYQNKSATIQAVYPTGNILCHCKVSLLDPIPLTTEILEKNGFEKIEGCVTAEAYILDKGEWGEANLIIRRFDFNESFVICTPKDQTARISIGYVHELQHALRLAGIKKEIVL